MDMSTKYLGLDLKNPLVAAASPLSREVSSVRQLEDAGVSAVVIHSLFQEQIEHEDAAHDHFMALGTESFAEALSYFPAQADYRRGPEQHLDHLTAVKKALGIPVIASLNCTSSGGWTEYAKKVEDTGADALELNVYSIATDPAIDAAAIEHRYIEILCEVKRTVRLPVSVKLTPYFSSFANFAKRLDDEGADGLVLFNRFHQPDIDLDALEVVPQVVLSAPHEMRMPLRWIAILDPLVKASLAATTGVYTSLDVLKLLMAGADVIQLCAALLRDGARATGLILDEMGRWMADHEYESVQQLQGIMNQRSCPDPAAFERGQYMKALNAYA